MNNEILNERAVTSEAPPILWKDSASREKSKTNLFDFANPRRRLSYGKIVQAGFAKKIWQICLTILAFLSKECVEKAADTL